MDLDEEPRLFRSDAQDPPMEALHYFPRNVSILKELPVDNIFQILSFSDPKDIFAFSQTCKAFLQITLTRTVWMNALRRVCEINSLFKPSFPFDNMSFSDLQRAATLGAVPRFARRLYKQEGDGVSVPLAPFHRRVFIPRVTKSSKVASEDPGTLKTLDLIPGGRFLIVTTSTLVHLCDLGYDAAKLIRPHALASIALPDPGGEPSISVLPTDDGTGLEVMVETRSYQLASRTCTIAHYRIFPLAAYPEFTPVSETPTVIEDLVDKGFLVKPGHCMLQRGRKIFIWNTARNLWVSWKAEEFPQEIFAYQNQIIAIGRKTITIWEIPMPHCDNADDSLLENYPSMLSLSHPFPRKSLDITSSTGWFSATSIKPCFLSLVGWKEDTRCIARYTMQSLARGANRNLPGSIPILMDTSPISGASDYLDTLDEIQPCGADALSVWTSETSPLIEVHISPMPTERQTEGPPFKTVRLFEYHGTGRPDDFDFSVCPITGRLCTMTGYNSEILVVDFLVPEWKDD
ncbi:hypothetical protein C8F04DRAFT_1185378 [Mycena alexandri]|uniref:F-box domain-containing protein n=1 Tax=Mycena alexandri TaxID=1745969 RepID=A0AAD6RVH1_9AGAR|nr:hypothetical protein C8F04DRAFT_1283307 [Mycena alexandri]KAJ7031914.1 hypothetical protein C8F04DRAFT_1185378 [Mycena alexandri]